MLFRSIDALAVLQQPGADDLLLQLVADEIEVGGGQLGLSVLIFFQM